MIILLAPFGNLIPPAPSNWIFGEWPFRFFKIIGDPFVPDWLKFTTGLLFKDVPFKPLMDKMTSGDYENLIKVFDDKFGSFVTVYR